MTENQLKTPETNTIHRNKPYDLETNYQRSKSCVENIHGSDDPRFVLSVDTMSTEASGRRHQLEKSRPRGKMQKILTEGP